MIARRDFLRGLTAAVTGFPAIVPASALGRDGKLAPSDRIVLGHIGVGAMGGGHLRRNTTVADVHIAAICDVQQSARDRAKNVVDSAYKDKACLAYADFRELLANPAIDAVLIATGERWHPLVTIEAARRGKHIYQEKPLGLSIAECQSSRAAVTRAGIAFQFGTQQRSSFNYRHACELVRNGRIGRLQTMLVASVYHPPDPVSEEIKAPPPGCDWNMWLGPSPWAEYSESRIGHPWMSITDYGLGMLDGGWGIHDIDTAQWVNDADATSPIEVEGRGVRFTDIRDAVYEWEVQHTYANGVKLIHMDLRTARLRAPQFNLFPFADGASVYFGTEGWIYVSRQGIVSNPASLVREIIPPGAKRVLRSDNHFGNFVNAVRTGSPVVSPIGAAAHAQTVNQQAWIAICLGRKLRWDPVKEQFDDAEANRRLARQMRSPWVI